MNFAMDSKFNAQEVKLLSLAETMRMVFYYRRPDFVPSSSAQRAFQIELDMILSGNPGSQGLRSLSLTSFKIPSELSLDTMMAGRTVPPVTTKKFMAYLRAEHTAENLHFILWCVRYHELFQALSPEEKALCPVWTKDEEKKVIQEEVEKGNSLRVHVTRLPTPPSMDSHMTPIYRIPSDLTPPSTADSDYKPSAISDCPDIAVIAPWESRKIQDRDIVDTHLSQASTYETNPRVTLNTLRAEVTTMLQTYIEQSTHSNRQLNLSHQERFLTTCALQHTLHPSAFHLAEESISRILRHESYPKFLTTTYANCNNARVKLAYLLGGLVSVLGFATFLIVTLSRHSRWYRLTGFPIFALGVYFTYSAFFGVCPVLQGFGHYQFKPWELDGSDEEDSEIDLEKDGSGSDEWISRYNSKSTFRHIFDPDTKIYNQRIRQGQILINCQGAVLGIAAATLISIPFLLVPPGNLF